MGPLWSNNHKLPCSWWQEHILYKVDLGTRKRAANDRGSHSTCNTMTLLRSLTRAVSRTTQYAAPLSKGYATVEKPVMLGNPPSPPLVVPRPLDVDQQVISASSDSGGPSLHRIVQEYERISGAVLGYSLPYESRPSSSRRCTFDEEASASISLVAHYLTTANGRGPSKITLSSAFAVAAEDPVNILTRSPSSLTDALC